MDIGDPTTDHREGGGNMRLQRQRVLTTIGVLGLIWAASVASAATTLDTTISTNTRLTVDGSPYILQGTTTVPAGVKIGRAHV